MGSSSSHRDPHSTNSSTSCGVKDYYHAAKREKTIGGISGAIGGTVSGAWEGRVLGPWGALGGAVLGGYTGYKSGKNAGFVAGLVSKAIDCHGSIHW
ncbi:hypothetical protein LBE40_08045 [Bartonella taylorii]|uniref:Glycine zipper 2TM domain-containing protein n=1 Tax=Bartonella taylorii 8TBB TaxID=1094560 RepID=A0A9P2S0U0_BARTA|nr:hypothetical protein [Bartonella taylorii]EJF97714.1 hypothetical protein ME9_00161 [Bartonella taylorii 8TBB]USP01209.1 hypothetical protein LBE40_08045 [Bartonella taylorii]